MEERIEQQNLRHWDVDRQMTQPIGKDQNLVPTEGDYKENNSNNDTKPWKSSEWGARV